MIAPEPAQHVRQNGPAHLLTMLVHSPGIVHVVASCGERLLHAHILEEPVAGGIVRAVGHLTAQIIAAVTEKYANRPLLALEDDVRISIAAAYVGEAAHIA